VALRGVTAAVRPRAVAAAVTLSVAEAIVRLRAAAAAVTLSAAGVGGGSAAVTLRARAGGASL
jgi:hypothetical protein